jgi:hypothetical protein
MVQIYPGAPFMQTKKLDPCGLAFLFLIVALMIETFILSVKVECGKAPRRKSEAFTSKKSRLVAD